MVEVSKNPDTPEAHMNCPVCGSKPGECYFQCPNSPMYYSPEAERADSDYFDSLSNDEVYAMQMREAGEGIDLEAEYEAEMEARQAVEDERIYSEPMDWEGDALMAQYDDDPNPYHGDYYESDDLPF